MLGFHADGIRLFGAEESLTAALKKRGGKNPAGIPECIAEAAKVLEGQLS